jgi:hypothetical protein
MELATTVKTDGSIEVTGDHHGRLVVAGSEPVTFGLAVVGLRADADGLQIDPAPRPRAVRGITRVAEDNPSVLLGGPDADAPSRSAPRRRRLAGRSGRLRRSSEHGKIARRPVSITRVVVRSTGESGQAEMPHDPGDHHG